MHKPFLHHASFSSFIQHFTPNWFAVNMGTGITALCLAKLQGSNVFIHDFAFWLWLFNTGLFCFFLGIWMLSLLLYPKLQLDLLKHSVLPFFLGCLPMAMTTVINGLVLLGLPLWGESVVSFAATLWMLNAAAAFLVAVLVPYFMFTSHDHSLDKMTAIWLLPIVAPEVAASSAGLIASHLLPHLAYPFLVLGYMLWGISLSLSCIIITLFFHRLVIHKLPVKELGPTIWLPLGPVSMGALGLLTLGQSADHLLQNGATMPGLALMHPLGLIGGIILLGFSTWLALIALLITLYYVRNRLSFNMSFWSFTFPLGVYTLSNLTLGADTGIAFFQYYGTVLTFFLVFIWVCVAVKTGPGFYRGNLIKNPLLG